MKKIVFNTLSIILLLSGAIFFSIPEINNFLISNSNSKQISDFSKKSQNINNNSDTYLTEKYDDLLLEMKKYNNDIFLNNQINLSDAWESKDANFNFDLIDNLDNQVGYINIDKMNIRLPLYMGASKANLAKGAAVLNQTSLPIGGINTNCVIAAHRGYRGAPMFIDIEKLEPGDEIEISNLWETLTYKVVKCVVISPDDIDAVKIVEKQDMVTLVTCHPYRHNYQRFVVYCSRASNSPVNADILPDGQNYSSSQKDVKQDILLNRVGGGAALLILIILLILLIKTIVKFF